MFTIYARNLLESIKIVCKFNTLVAYFCQHHLLQYIVYGILTLTGICLGMPKIVGIIYLFSFFFFFFFWGGGGK